MAQRKSVSSDIGLTVQFNNAVISYIPTPNFTLKSNVIYINYRLYMTHEQTSMFVGVVDCMASVRLW